MQEELAIEIRNATVKLEGFEALHDFSWSVRRGERWFVLGPNGAGKTTLVKLMLGLVWPLYGATVSVLGNRYGSCDIYEIRKRVAWASPFLNTWASDPTYRRWTALEIVLSGIDSTVGFFRTASPGGDPARARGSGNDSGRGDCRPLFRPSLLRGAGQGRSLHAR